VIFTKNIEQHSITVTVSNQSHRQFQKRDESFEYQQINDNVPAQTVIEEPFDSNTSDTTRIVKDNQQESCFSMLFGLVSVTYFSS
jgi:hypothetical protein